MNRENYCGTPHKLKESFCENQIPINTITNFAHTNYLRNCNIEPFQMTELGYQRACGGEKPKIPSSPLGLPISCNNMTEAGVCNPPQGMNVYQKPLTFDSTRLLKFLNCMPANTRLAVEDPDNPLTFMIGCPYNPDCNNCGNRNTGC